MADWFECCWMSGNTLFSFIGKISFVVNKGNFTDCKSLSTTTDNLIIKLNKALQESNTFLLTIFYAKGSYVSSSDTQIFFRITCLHKRGKL